MQMLSPLVRIFFLFYQSLLQKIVIPSKLQVVPSKDLFFYDFKADIMYPNCVHFGYAFLNSVKEHCLSASDVAKVKSKCLNYLVNTTEEVQKRVPENVAIFQAVSAFSPAKILAVSDVAMPTLCLRMSVKMLMPLTRK